MVNLPTEETLYDAIVVGAGPSGCAAALFLARAGRQVLLIDKATFPREKVCGDALSGKTIGVLRELGLLSGVEKNPHGVIQGVKFVSPKGQEVTVPFPHADGMECAGYTERRVQSDAALFSAASAQANISILQGFSVNALVRDGKGAVCGISGNEGKSDGISAASGAARTFHARVVMGADGSGSVVARQLGLPPVPPEHLYMAIRGYWSNVTGLTDNIELFFIDGVLPGYFWIFPMETGMANVGLGILASDVKKRGAHPNKILEEAISKHPSLSARFAGAKREGSIGAWTIPNGSHKRQNFGEGWVLVGDAASLVDPFSGEGYGNALSSGKFAARAIDEAIRAKPGREPLAAADLASYSARVEKELRPEMMQSYQLQQASRSRFLLNLFIGKAATKPEMRQMVIDMLASDEEKKQVQNPLFYLKLLLP